MTVVRLSFQRLQHERRPIQAFDFEDAGRNYSCSVQERKGAGAWWWFAVTGDMQTYAPFQAAATDTHDSVKDRIVQFYTSRLFQLSQPTQRGSHWSRRTAPAKPAPVVSE